MQGSDGAGTSNGRLQAAERVAKGTLTCAAYRITHGFSRPDWYLRDQIRRAAISIGANIAEGCGRNGDGELRRFLNIALGSANELCCLLELAVDVEALSAADGRSLIEAVAEVRRMLSALSRAATRGSSSSTPKGGRPNPAPSSAAS